MIINPSWSFEEAVSEASALHQPGGIYSGAARNEAIDSWAAAVGRERAIAGLAGAAQRFGSRSAAAKALRMSWHTWKGFEKSFAAMPSSEPVGLTLFFPSRLSFISKTLVDAVLASLVGPDEMDCRSAYEATDSGALIRLHGLPLDRLLGVADQLGHFFHRHPHAEVARMVEAAIPSAVDRAIEKALPMVLARTATPIAQQQARLGEQLTRQLETMRQAAEAVYAEVARTEVKLSDDTIAALQTAGEEVLDNKLAEWRFEPREGKLIRGGAWSVSTGAVASGLVELAKLLALIG